MANSTTVKAATVVGNLLMEVGVLIMGDSNTGLAVQSSIKDYLGGSLTPKSAANGSALTFVSGGFKAGTAASGSEFHYVVFGN